MKKQPIPVNVLVLMALCCVLALFSKRILSPITNPLTDLLQLPGGGVSAGLGFAFLILGASAANRRCTATLMGLTQGLLALILGMAGNQGPLAPVTYMIPGIAIDLIRALPWKNKTGAFCCIASGGFASCVNAASTGLMVFQFHGVLLLWIVTAVGSGMLGGLLAWLAGKRISLCRYHHHE